MIIAIVGHRATGKDTAAEILEDLGYRSVSFSENIARVAIEHGWMEEQERTEKPALQKAAQRVRSELGASSYLDRMMASRVVLSGLRDPSELDILRSSDFGVLVIGLTAPDEIRAERAASLGIVSSVDELRALEQHVTDQRIDELLAQADVLVENDGSVAELRTRLERVVKRYEELH